MLHPIPESEVEWTAVRAQGPGGQNVNKVSSAVHLRFNVALSSLPEAVKARLLAQSDQRLTQDGTVVIKAQRSRSQETNKAEAMERLQAMVDAASRVPRPRKATQPSFGAKMRRLDAKGQRSEVKAQRAKPLE